MLRKRDCDVKLCPRCYLRGRLQRLQGTTHALLCLGCGRVYTAQAYIRARAMTYNKLQRRIRAASHEEVEDVSAAAV